MQLILTDYKKYHSTLLSDHFQHITLHVPGITTTPSPPDSSSDRQGYDEWYKKTGECYYINIILVSDIVRSPLLNSAQLGSQSSIFTTSETCEIYNISTSGDT